MTQRKDVVLRWPRFFSPPQPNAFWPAVVISPSLTMSAVSSIFKAHPCMHSLKSAIFDRTRISSRTKAIRRAACFSSKTSVMTGAEVSSELAQVAPPVLAIRVSTRNFRDSSVFTHILQLREPNRGCSNVDGTVKGLNSLCPPDRNPAVCIQRGNVRLIGELGA